MPTDEKDDKKVEDQDPRITAADDAAEFAELLVKAAKKRTEAAMTPGEVSAALKDTKDAKAAQEKAKADMKAAKEAIKKEELAEKSRLATAEAAAKIAAESEKSAAVEAKKTEATPA